MQEELIIRPAGHSEYTDVREFYYNLIDAMENAEYKPAWEKDVYPTQEFLIESIENKELYVAEDGQQIVACMVVNHEYNDGYKGVHWSIDAKDEELLVIHALGVHADFTGQGIAKQLVQKVIDMAEESHIKTIRLDVLEGNIPAEKTYTGMGFRYVDTLKMFYEDTGWTNFKLYEYIV